MREAPVSDDTSSRASGASASQAREAVTVLAARWRDPGPVRIDLLIPAVFTLSFGALAAVFIGTPRDISSRDLLVAGVIAGLLTSAVAAFYE